jgi:hypothetical protein
MIKLITKGLLQTDFANRMNLAGAKAGVAQNQATNYTNNANRTAGMFQGIGAGVGQGLLAYGADKKKDGSQG